MANNFRDKFVQRLLNGLKDKGLFLKDAEQSLLLDALNMIFDYCPNIGILGKTGVGKSSLCNALFGEKIAKISDVEACTRNVQEILLPVGDKGINLFDVPGVGENSERDKEYANLYSTLLPKLDLVIWVLSMNDRAYETDLRFYEKVFKSRLGNVPFLIVINKAELMEPAAEYFNSSPRALSVKQKENIEAKKQYVSQQFGIPIDRIVEISATEEINLATLLVKMITLLPPNAALSLANRAKPIQPKPGEQAVNIESSAWQKFVVIADAVISNIPGLGVVYKAIKGIFNFLKSLFS